MNEVHLPQPHEVGDIEKDDAMGAYFMMFVSWAVGLPLPTLNLIAAWIYFALNSRTSRYVAFHAYQSLLSQIPVTLLNTGTAAWLLTLFFTDFETLPGFLVYLSFVAAANILYIILSVVALVRARRGETFYIPIFGKLSYRRYYGLNAISMNRGTPNSPP